MPARISMVLAVFAVVVTSVIAPLAREQHGTLSAPAARDARYDPVLAAGSLPLDTFVVATYGFDDGLGGPDPQGWTTVDVTAQPVYFHVDDFGGMPAPWAPLGGAQSMWLGTRASSDPPLCTWVHAPGYGNNWRQELRSSEFAVAGDVTISYEVRWDSEAGYDFSFLQYRSPPGAWNLLQVQGGISPDYAGSGQMSESIMIPAANHSGTIQFRFLFTSDGGVSDEDGLLGFDFDGAIVIDDLVVSDANGTVDSQDFESEAVDATETLDGDWVGSVAAFFGDHADLFDGTTVLQEDPGGSNDTYLWGFFAGSTNDLGCAGHPEQATVPLGKPVDLPNSSHIYIINEARSPFIDIMHDENGIVLPPSAPVIVSYDAYHDMTTENGIRYKLFYRGIVDGCPEPWLQSLEMYGDEKQWFRNTHDISSGFFGIDPAATEVQIALRCYDINFMSNPCHTHAPLFDNVQVGRIADAATGIRNHSGSRIVLRNEPNPFNPSTTIRYEIDRTTHVRLTIYSASGARVLTLVDGLQDPAAGGHSVVWDGRDERGVEVASGVYFCRLDAGGSTLARKMLLLK